MQKLSASLGRLRTNPSAVYLPSWSPTPRRVSQLCCIWSIAFVLAAGIVYFGLPNSSTDIYVGNDLSPQGGGDVVSVNARLPIDGNEGREELESGDVSPQQQCQTIVFFHIPKTGGQSMNSLWQGPNARFGWQAYRNFKLRSSANLPPGLTSMDLDDQREFLENIKPWMSAASKMQHVLLELHCGDSISFMQAHAALQTMRKSHKKNGCGFFAFTVIRSPLEWVVSLYDDICHRRLIGHKDSCPQRDDMTPKEEMLHFPHWDGTSAYLTHGWNKWDSPGPVDKEAVQALVEKMETGLDMVGITADVTQIRKYLTARFASSSGILTQQENASLDTQAKKNQNLRKTIYLSDFTPDEADQLNATVLLDWDLYKHFENKPRPWG